MLQIDREERVTVRRRALFFYLCNIAVLIGPTPAPPPTNPPPLFPPHLCVAESQEVHGEVGLNAIDGSGQSDPAEQQHGQDHVGHRGCDPHNLKPSHGGGGGAGVHAESRRKEAAHPRARELPPPAPKASRKRFTPPVRTFPEVLTPFQRLK